MPQPTQFTAADLANTEQISAQDIKQLHIEKLFKEHRQVLQNYLRKWVQSPEDVQEILQETWLHALKSGNVEKLQSSSGKSFLYTIATNLVRDRHRTHYARRYAHHESTEDGPEILCDKPKPEDYVAYDEARTRLLDALKDLAPKYSEVFVMHRFMDKSHAEIASSLNLSVRTVERYMAAALKHCRESLQDYL